MKPKAIYPILLAILFLTAGCVQDRITQTKTVTSVLRETRDGYKYYLYQDVEYLGQGRNEKLDIYIPFNKPENNNGYPAVLNIHGGGWVEGYKSRKITKTCAEVMVEKGYAVICNDYLLNTKHQNAWPTNIYDCKTALRYIRKIAKAYNIDPDNIGVLGNSAGGHLAMLMGYSADSEELNSSGLYRQYPTDLKCVVNIYGIPDLRSTKWARERFVNVGQDKQKVLTLASPITHLDKNSPPTLSIHGDTDSVVPFRFTEDLDKALKAKGLVHEIVAVKGGKHAFTLYPDGVNRQTDLRPAVIKFLDKHLKH